MNCAKYTSLGLLVWVLFLLVQTISPANAKQAVSAQPSRGPIYTADYELNVLELSNPPYVSGDEYRLLFSVRILSGETPEEFRPIESIGTSPGLFLFESSNCSVYSHLLPFGIFFWQVIISKPHPGAYAYCDVRFSVLDAVGSQIFWHLVAATDPDQSNNFVELNFDPNGTPRSPAIIPTLNYGGLVALVTLVLVVGMLTQRKRSAPSLPREHS